MSVHIARPNPPVRPRPAWTLRCVQLLALLLGLAGCTKDEPVAPPPSPPRVEFRLLATFAGTFPGAAREHAWSPVGKRLVFEHMLDLDSVEIWVFDADQPANPPQLVHTGEMLWLVSWSPDGQWVLCATNPSYPLSRITLVAFQATANATPHVLYTGTNVNWAVWGANGMIYWWDAEMHVRHRISPPAEWTPGPSGPFPDRTIVAYLRDPASTYGFRPHWFQTQPEEEGWFDGQNPGEYGDEIQLVADVFADGQRFLVDIPSYCGMSGIVDRHGKLLTSFGTVCDHPPFTGLALTADDQYVTGVSQTPSDSTWYWPVQYCADVAATWRVPIENTPTASEQALSNSGYWLAYQKHLSDSLCVGELVFTDTSH
jgi:hypothetical protein